MARETVTGYCWPQSVEGGDEVGLHLSSAGSRPVRVEVARCGWKRDVVLTDTVPADFHPTPLDAAQLGCGWPAARTIPVDPAWRSGFYEVVLEIDVDGKVRREHAFFVVRPKVGRPTARILLALATNTWHAYNDFGGRNLYSGGTSVSLQRPMERGYLHKPMGLGRRVTLTGRDDPQMNAHTGYLRANHLSPWAGSAGWPDWELPFLQWAEREGYAIDVVTNVDLEEHPGLLGDGAYDLYLSVGHDEYWSMGMRDTVEAHIARGGHAAFFSGNTSLWQVRFEDPTPEGPAATMVGFKAMVKKDPLWGTDRIGEATTLWSHPALGRPENHMTGVTFTRGGYHRIGRRATNGLGGYTVHRPDHWLFDGTDIGYGDVIGTRGITVGYECDGCTFTYVNGLPVPTHEDGTPETMVILGTVPVAHFTRTTSPRPPGPNEPSELEGLATALFGDASEENQAKIATGHAVLGIYTSQAGGHVVTSGSTDWAHGLAGQDPEIEQITRNVLDRATARS